MDICRTPRTERREFLANWRCDLPTALKGDLNSDRTDSVYGDALRRGDIQDSIRGEDERARLLLIEEGGGVHAVSAGGLCRPNLRGFVMQGVGHPGA